MALSAIATGEAGCLKCDTPTSAGVKAASVLWAMLSGLVEGTMCHIGLPVCADCKSSPTVAEDAAVATLQVCGDCSSEAGEGSRVATGQ